MLWELIAKLGRFVRQVSLLLATVPGFISFAHAADPARLRLEKTSESPWPANVGAVEIWPALGSAPKFSLLTAEGKPVQFLITWTALGEPTLIRFNTSSRATAYYVAFDTNAAPATGGWQPEAGVLIETRACQEQPVNTRDQLTRLISSASPIYGRTFVPNVFLGMNPLGPSGYYVALFSGWFSAPQAGEYGFATISTEASSLQIDGRLLAEWLGRHGPHGGRRAEHSGRIQLKPGVHHLDYLQVQFDSGEAAGVAAWKPPGEDHFDIMPPSAFFPVARFHAIAFDPATADQLYFEWQTADHCRLGDALIVRTRLRVLDEGRGRTYKWRFDDGGQETGVAVQHFFLQGGLRQVLLEAWDHQTCLATNNVRIRVEPNWLQREDWRQDVFDDAKREFLRRDLAQMSPRDLAGLLQMAERADDQQLLNRAGEAIIARPDDFSTSAYAGTFYRLGLSLQHEGDWGDRLAEKALRLALAPQRAVPAIIDKAKLRLADLLIHRAGELDEAEKFLIGLSINNLTADERRLWKLLQADLLLARGKFEEARKQYFAVGEAPSRPAGRLGLGVAAVLESATISLQRGDYDEAQHTLDRLAFDVPLERMSPATGLLRIDLNLKRKEYERAFVGCLALLPMSDHAPQQPDLFYDLVQSGLALGKTDDAQRALRQLLKEFPYSEAAAKAKDQWSNRK